MTIEVKFKKIHPNAQLPLRKHGNREINDYERKWMDEENKRFEQERPDHYAAGYRVGYPIEMNIDGSTSARIIGTGDTGYDLFCVEDKIIPANGSAIVDTGIEVAYISPGYWFMICNRSGLGFKGLRVHPGIIDNPYTGSVSIMMFNLRNTDYQIKCSDRIAQLVFFPVIEPKISWSNEKLHVTERGDGGFGSTGR